MALIKCPECGKEVSESAKVCPNCGYPITEGKEKQHQKSKKKFRISLIVIAFVVLLAIIAVIIFFNSGNRAGKKDLFGTVAVGEIDDELTGYIDSDDGSDDDYYPADGVWVKKWSNNIYSIYIDSEFEGVDGDLVYRIEDGITTEKSFQVIFISQNSFFFTLPNSSEDCVVSSTPREDSKNYFDKLVQMFKDSYGEPSSYTDTQSPDSMVLYTDYEVYTWEREDSDSNIYLTYSGDSDDENYEVGAGYYSNSDS